MFIRYRCPALVAALSIAFAPAFGADEGAVIVTASRFASSALREPIAIQVIGAEEIRESSATTVAEVLHKLGGVHTRINFVGIPDAPLDLRGFGMTGNENSLVLVDGQRISENEQAAARLSAIPMNSIDRIEILRGAGAVLYGGGATGGTINIVTKAPVADGPGGSVSATLGSYDLLDLRGRFETGAAGWGLALNAQRYENNNYRQNNRASQTAANGELRFGDRDGFIALSLGSIDQKARLPGARSEAELASDPRGAATPNDYMNTRVNTATVRGERKSADVTLAFDIGQRGKKADMFNEPAWGTSKAKTDVNVTTVSPRMLWNTRVAGIANRLTVGVDWSNWTYKNGTTGTGFMSSLDESGKQANRALYVRDELNFATGTRVTLGGRREKVKQQHREQLVPRPEASIDHFLSASELALQQELGAGYSAYGRVGRSFRVANIDDNRCWFAPCAALLKPQRSNDREIGLQWQDGASRWRASLFDIALEDEIHYNAIVFTNMNLSPTKRRGFELDGQRQLSKTFDLGARYGHTQARFRSGTYLGIDVAGKDVPLVPRDRAGLRLGWQLAPATRATLNLDYVGRQRYDNDQANNYRYMPAYTVTDVKLLHQLGAWRFAAGINNLFDKAYYTYGIVNGTFTSFNAYPEMRRSAYASAEYSF